MSIPSLGVLRERARYVYRFTLVPRLLLLLPMPWAYGAGRRLGRFRYRRHHRLLRPHAAEMRARLGVSPEQVERWLERCSELALSEDLDWQLFSRLQRHNLSPLIEMVGREQLGEVLTRRRGAILYTGHLFGHFTFVAALGVLGYRPNLIIGTPQTGDRWYPERRHGLLERLGCHLLRMESGAFGLAVNARNALRRNEVVIMEIDESLSEPAVELPFLGAPATFSCGPALLAQATGAPLLFFSIRRPERWLPQIAAIGPPYYPSDDVTAAVRHCASRLEAAILADPPSWGPWLYPRKPVWSTP